MAMSTQREARDEPTYKLLGAQNQIYSAFHQHLFRLRTLLQMRKAEAWEAKYELNVATAEVRKARLSYMDKVLERRTKKSEQASKKLQKMMELFDLWRDASGRLNELQDAIMRYGELLAFVNRGCGTEEEKKNCEAFAPIVIAKIERMLEQGVQIGHAEQRVEALGCHVGAPFEAVLTKTFEELTQMVHDVSH